MKVRRSTTSETPPRAVAGGLWAAVVMGAFTSLCCIGPLLLVVAGIGGAWVADITVLDPIRPELTVVTLVLLGVAHFRNRRRRSARCDCPKSRDRSALWLWLGTALVLISLTAPYWLPALIVPTLPRTP
ncbi:MAG: mercuric transporter MerT family protein [Acidiferrobacter sp.]